MADSATLAGGTSVKIGEAPTARDEFVWVTAGPEDPWARVLPVRRYEMIRVANDGMKRAMVP